MNLDVKLILVLKLEDIGVVSEEDATIFDISVTSPSTIFMSSDIPAFRCNTYLTKVN